MKKVLKTFILAVCLALSSLFCLTACGKGKETAKVLSFSVELTNESYTLNDDTITVSYGEDYRLSFSDFSLTATFDDKTSKTLTLSELEDLGFTLSSTIPNDEITPVGEYTLTFGNKNVAESDYVTINLKVIKKIININAIGLIWKDEVTPFVYDGEYHINEITNLPEYLEIEGHNDNSAKYPKGAVYPDTNITVGSNYAQVSIKVKDEYKDRYVIEGTASIQHPWIIEKAEMSVPDIDLTDAIENYTYNGAPITTKIRDEIKEQLESLNISTSLSGTLAETNVGEYQVTISFTYTGDDKTCYNLGEDDLIGTRNATWEISPKELANLELYLTGFKYDNPTGNYVCEKTLSSADGIIGSDNVTLTIKACRPNAPANGMYELWYNKDMQGEVEIIACNNSNYTFENGSNGCGVAYVCDSFDTENGMTTGLPRDTYYILELELEANSSMKYRFETSTTNISCSLKGENLSAISYDDGFTLTNDTDSTKTFVVYMIVGGQGTIKLYNHRAVLMNGESIYQTLNVVDGYDISNIMSSKTHYTFGGWYTEEKNKVTTITSDITLYANYTPAPYTITYTNTESMENTNPTTYNIETETITLTPLVRNYYTFDGWYYKDTKITEIPKGFTGGDITLQAKWTATPYTVTYQDTKDVVNPNPIKYTIEDGEITLKRLTDRVDCTFRGWERVYDNDYQIDPYLTTTISVSKHKGNLTLKAIWDKKTEYDAFTYTVSENCLEATITGLTNTSSTSITIPKGVVAIGNNAFKNCTTLTTVNFEEESQLLTIGDYAFYYCGIRSITIPKTVTEIEDYAFARSGISEMKFSSETSLTTIGNYAFAECNYLTEFTIPDSVVSMGQNVFNVCINLTKIVFGKGMTVIGENIYGSSSVLRAMEFKGEITSFHKNALKNVTTGNVTLILSMNQKNLEQEAYRNNNGGTDYSDEYFAESRYYRVVSTTSTFCGCNFSEICLTCDATEMTAEEFSSKLESGSNTAFTTLKFILPASADNYFTVITTFISKYENSISIKLTIDGATTIPTKAFNANAVGYRLKEVIIGDSVTSIGDESFEYGLGLEKVTFGKGLTSLGEFAFYGCWNLKKIEIPDSVTIIGKNCFDNCQHLESVKLSASITEIGNNVFAGCTALKSLIIPNGVTEIGSQALLSCEALESIVIPNSVTYIDVDATYKCNALTKVYYTGTASEWQSISICHGDNDPLKTATIYYYSKTQPSGDGKYWHYDEDGNPVVWGA